MTTPTDTEKLAQALRKLSTKWRSQGEAIGPSVGHLARTYCADDLDELLEAHESRAQPASVADGWREKFDELLEDYAGARAEVAVWNVTQSVQPPTGIRLPRSRLAKLLAHVDKIAAAPQPAKDVYCCRHGIPITKVCEKCYPED